MMRARSHGHGKPVIYLAKSWCLSNRYVWTCHDWQFPCSHDQHCMCTFSRQAGCTLCAKLYACHLSLWTLPHAPVISRFHCATLRHLILFVFHPLFNVPSACFSPSIISPSGSIVNTCFPYKPVNYSRIQSVWILTRFSPPLLLSVVSLLSDKYRTRVRCRAQCSTWVAEVKSRAPTSTFSPAYASLTVYLYLHCHPTFFFDHV